MTETSSPARSRATTGVLGIAFAALVAALVLVPMLRPTGLLRDFSAFYCAGAAIDAGGDPYRAEPIGTCERAPKPPGLHRGIPGLSVPAPLPPFALAAFAAVARLPYGVAAVLWTVVLLAAFAASIGSLVRLGVEPLFAVASLALTDGYASLALGQIAPVAIAALLLAGAAAECARFGVAGGVCAVSLIEPHLAVPSLFALGIARREARLPAAAVVFALAAIGLAAVGPATCLEYVRDVLPAHARSEITSTRQFSLTAVLDEAGVPAAEALRAGEASYVAAAIVGAAVGMRLAGRFGPSFLVVAPMAFAVVGGPFVHIVQMAAATPLALLLLRRQTAFRGALESASVALSVPWVQFATLGGVLTPLAAIVTATIVLGRGRRPRLAVLAAFAAIALIAGIDALVFEAAPDPIAELVRYADGSALAEASWGRYVVAVGSADRAAYDLARLPTWLGAVTVASLATIMAFGGKGSQARKRTR